MHHLAVLGEGAGLVGANHRDRAQALHRRQPADEGGVLHHPLGANGEGDRDHGRQSLGNDGNRHRQGHFQQIQQGLTQPPAEQHNNRYQGQGAAHQYLGQAIQTLLQGGGFTPGGVDQFGDLAQLGGHARAGDHGHGPAPHHFGALEQAVLAFEQGASLIQHKRCLLKHSLRFAREGRLPHPQIGHLQQPRIGGHPIASLEAHQVAKDKLLTGQPLPLAIAANLDHRLGHVAQGQQRLLGLALLQIAQQAVQAHDQHNGNGVFGELLFHKGNHRRDGCHGQQHQQHHIAELIPKDLPRASSGRQFQAVGAVARQPFCNLGGC